MNIILNILWLIFGGLVTAFGWLIAAAIMAITIIGLLFAPSALRIARYTQLPFGSRVEDTETEFAGLGNLVWIILAGWWLALGHLICAIGLAVTIIGLPFAWAHLKLAGLCLVPLGTKIVPTE